MPAGGHTDSAPINHSKTSPVRTNIINSLKETRQIQIILCFDQQSTILEKVTDIQFSKLRILQLHLPPAKDSALLIEEAIHLSNPFFC
jgi:hypothetical protein